VLVVQVLRVRDMMSLKFSEKVYEGFWFSPEMEYLQNAMDFCQRWAVVPRTEHFVDDT
jgi:argininosuccinate synthase